MSSVIDDTHRPGNSGSHGRSHSIGPASPRNLLAAWTAAVLLPLAIALDTWRAVAKGWSLGDAGGLALLYWLSLVAAVGTSLAMLFWPGFRRRLGHHAPGVVCLTAGLLLGIAVAEGLVRRLVPPAPFHGRTPHAQYRLQPDPRVLPGVRQMAHLRYDALGRRYDPTAPAAPTETDHYVHIVCIGGSTTECLYLDDTETWPARLGQRLRRHGIDNQTVAVARTGCGSGHHARLLSDPRRTDIRRADCIVMLLGADDLTRAVLARSDGRSPGPLWFRSALAHLMRDIWNGYLGHGIVCDATGQWFTILRRTRSAGPFDREELQSIVEQRVAQYRQTLSRLARAAERREQPLLLVTQPVLWDARLTPEARKRLWLARDPANDLHDRPRDAPGRFSPELLRRLIDRFNRVVIETATAHGTLCVDAAATMSGQEQFFYDDFHLNESGCDTLALLVADALADRLVRRATSPSSSAGRRIAGTRSHARRSPAGRQRVSALPLGGRLSSNAVCQHVVCRHSDHRSASSRQAGTAPHNGPTFTTVRSVHRTEAR